jgi:hypothetical protein
LAFPPDVLATNLGVSEVRWWGAKTVIAWKDVVRVDYNPLPGTAVVVSRSGTRVVHSSWNRDQSGFLEACLEHTGLRPGQSKA